MLGMLNTLVSGHVSGQDNVNVTWIQILTSCNCALPQDIHGPEDREMLARLAASAEDDQSADSEAAIEKYLRSVLAVENVLTLDRLRQVRESLFFSFQHRMCIFMS